MFVKMKQDLIDIGMYDHTMSALSMITDYQRKYDNAIFKSTLFRWMDGLMNSSVSVRMLSNMFTYPGKERRQIQVQMRHYLNHSSRWEQVSKVMWNRKYESQTL